ncbi:MAG TPA: hypothetical protein VHG91_19245 [Longimicrobium sp.]|nr:hypothetical protein [Longimicrobium sp.]
MHSVLLAAALACAGCADRDPLGAAVLSPDAAVQPAPTLEGCARLVVAVSARDEVTVSADTVVRCGPVVPVVALGATLDRVRRRVRIPVVLENRGSARVRGTPTARAGPRG